MECIVIGVAGLIVFGRFDEQGVGFAVFRLFHQASGQMGIREKMPQYVLHLIMEFFIAVDDESQGTGLGIEGVHENMAGQFTDTVLIIDSSDADESHQAHQQSHEGNGGESEHQFHPNGPVGHGLFLIFRLYV